MLLEDRQILFLESHPLVVPLLILDVCDAGLQERAADGESTITVLPVKQPGAKRIMYPFGRAALDELNCFGYRHDRRQREQTV